MKQQSRRSRAAQFFRQAPLGFLGLLLVVPFLVAAVAPHWIAPYDPIATDTAHALEGPSLRHWLGTDNLGRDQLSRVIFGAQPSLAVGLISVVLAVLVGAPLGLLAGYRLGIIDHFVMRTMDTLQVFPAVVLALAITAALGPGVSNAIIAIAVVYAPFFARLARGQVLAAREEVYVEAARASGAGGLRIVIWHLLPNVVSPLIIQFYLTVAYAIVLEATLSFLGVGVQPPAPSWGSMLKSGYAFLGIAPGLSIVPGAAIMLMVLGLMLLGDAIWLALDPRQARRGTAVAMSRSGGAE